MLAKATLVAFAIIPIALDYDRGLKFLDSSEATKLTGGDAIYVFICLEVYFRF